MRLLIVAILVFVLSVSMVCAEPIDITDWYNTQATGVPGTYYRGSVTDFDGSYRYVYFDVDPTATPDEVLSGVLSRTIEPIDILDGIYPMPFGYVDLDAWPMIYYFSLGGETFRVRRSAFGFFGSFGLVTHEAMFNLHGSSDYQWMYLEQSSSRLFIPDESSLLALAEMYGLTLEEGLSPKGNVETGIDLMSSETAVIAVTVLALAYGFYGIAGLGFGGVKGG